MHIQTTSDAVSPAVATKPVRRAREASNQKYANDGSLASVEHLLRKFAGQYTKIAMAKGLAMDFDDCMQECHLSYVQARAKWSPDAALFSTYVSHVVKNNFFSRIEKEMRERDTFGMRSYDAKVSDEGEALADPLEGYESDNPMSSPLDMLQSEEDRQIEMAQARVKLSRMSMNAKKLLAVLLSSEREQTATPPKLRECAKQAGIAGDDLRAVKAEILAAFGIRFAA